MITFFKNFNTPQILPIKKSDIDDILELGDIVFKGELADNKSYLLGATDWDISVKLVIKNKIIGFYLFKANDMSSKDIIFKDKKGIEGVALGVDSKYRNKGYGKMLIEKSYELFKNDYDYIWGMHLRTLNNLEDWKKRRTIINGNSTLFLSYKFFN